MSTYWFGVGTVVCIYMIAILGVSILCGFTGLFSMGHAGFMAIGGYTSALLTKHFGVPIVVGVLGGMLLAMLLGMLISYPTLKLKDDYFIIVTLGIGEAIKLVIQNLDSVTGGARGLTDIPPLQVKGFPLHFFIVLALVIVIVVILRNFLRSKYGRNCVAVREEELAAAAVGIKVFNYKMLAMAISCALCGIAGALLGHYMHFLQPDMFSRVKSDELCIAVILGGRGSLTGTILASLVLLPLPEFLRFEFAQEWRMVLYGFLVVMVILFRPAGLMGTRELTVSDLRYAWRKFTDLFRKKSKGA